MLALCDEEGAVLPAPGGGAGVTLTHSGHSVAGFTKLFATIVHSTVWRTDMHVKVVWITMLALADRQGKVSASVPGLADAARVTLDQCMDALKQLAAPDRWSRTKAHQGRRIQECEGGWILLNYAKYRGLREVEERRVQTRQAVRRYRARQKAAVSRGKPRKPKKAQAEAEAEAEKIVDQDLPAPKPRRAPKAPKDHTTVIAFEQLVAIAKAERRPDSTEWKEAVKDRLVALGFAYPLAGVLRAALDAVEARP